MTFRIYCVLGILLSTLWLRAQNLPAPSPSLPPDKQTDLEQILENSGAESGEYDNNTFLEKYDIIAGKKFNLNKITREQLEELEILDYQQIESLLNYISSFGPMKSLYELQGVYGLDKETIKMILPFVTVTEEEEQKLSLKDYFLKGKNSVFFRYNQYLEEAKGYTEPDSNSTTRYAGDRSHLYFRYRYTFKTNLSIGLTIEKDPGEMFWSKAYKGFDYISGHVFFMNIGPIKALALGDFDVNLGQGLIIYQGFGLGKSADVTKLKRNIRTLGAHTSANEYNFFRGAAATFGLGKKKAWDLTILGSYRFRDANVLEADSLSEDIEAVSSLQTSGYHRTPSEIEDRNAIAQANAGGSVKWRGKKAQVGLNALYTHLSNPLETSDEPYNYYDFKGNSLLNVSSDYSFLHKKLLLFGEAAFSQNGGFAVLNTAIIKAFPGMDLAFSHRYFAKNYQSLFANSFGESSEPVNETGFYTGIVMRPAKFITVESYFDLYYFPWLRYLIDAPSTGMEIYSRLTISPARNFNLYLQGRYETKAENVVDNETPIDYPEPYKKGSLRGGWMYIAHPQITLNTRVEASWYKEFGQEQQNGFYAAQDITFRDKQDKFSASGRIAMFRTDSYDTRIYAYENDVLYSFAIPANYGRGMRWYALFKYSPCRYADIWIRLAQTVFTDRDVISSGLDEIQGNKRTEIKAQLRIKW